MRTLPLLLAIGLSTSALAAPPQRFSAQLSGGDANGNVIETNATGQASFEILDEADGPAIAYRVNVAGIRNLWMAHIHVSDEPGGNGPPAFWFVPTTPQAGPAPGQSVVERIQGNLASGFIMSNDQLGGLLAGATIADLIAAMEEGRAYVVVHTNDFDPDTPSGVAGDSPPGELRGAIR